MSLRLLDLVSSHILKSLALVLISRVLKRSDQDDSIELVDDLDILLLEAEDKKRMRRNGEIVLPERFGRTRNEVLSYLVMDKNAPWLNISYDTVATPGMLTSEEVQYYHYICGFYTGQGEVVELGPWLGLSTCHLVAALLANPTFSGKLLHVFDDFVWRSSWMDQYLAGEVKMPGNYQDFRMLFDRYTATIAGHLNVNKSKFADYEGNEDVPTAGWDGKPIELMIVDCGRTIKANQGWYDIFSPAFIPGQTLVVMQDWRLHRERPRKRYNQTHYFTEANPRLHLAHEVSDGGVATFLFR